MGSVHMPWNSGRVDPTKLVDSSRAWGLTAGPSPSFLNLLVMGAIGSTVPPMVTVGNSLMPHTSIPLPIQIPADRRDLVRHDNKTDR